MTLGSKLFGPDVFGQYMFVNSISLTFAVLVCLRGDHFILAKNDISLEKTINTFLSISILILIICISIVVVYWVTVGANYAQVSLILAGILLAGANANFQLLGSALIKTEKLKVFSYSSIIKPTIMCLGQIFIFMLAPLLAFAMILPRLLGDISAFLIRFRTIKNTPFVFDKDQVAFIKSNYKYCVVGTIASFLNVLSQQMPMLLLPILFGYAALGYFSLAFSLVVIPVTLLLSPLRSLLIKEYASHNSKNKVFNKFTLLLMPISIVGVLFAFFASEPIVLAIWGKEWLQTALYIKLISIWAASGLLNAPSFAYIIATEKQEYLLYLEVLFIFIKIAILGGAYFLGTGLVFTCIYIVLSGVFYNLILIIFAKVKVYNECNKRNTA